jgi:hypothetical protein
MQKTQKSRSDKAGTARDKDARVGEIRHETVGFYRDDISSDCQKKAA